MVQHYEPSEAGKWLGLLKEAAPNLARVAEPRNYCNRPELHCFDRGGGAGIGRAGNNQDAVRNAVDMVVLARSAFTRVTACTLAPSPIRDALSEGFSHFVTSIAAPVASGWSGCRVGLAPTGKRRLVTAHTRPGHWPPCLLTEPRKFGRVLPWARNMEEVKC